MCGPDEQTMDMFSYLSQEARVCERTTRGAKSNVASVPYVSLAEANPLGLLCAGAEPAPLTPK